MIKRLKISLIIILIGITTTMSCSTYDSYVYYKEGIDTDLQKYVDYVNQLTSDFSKLDSITFYNRAPKNIKDNYTIGYCSYSFIHWKPYVKINKHWWKDATDRERILLIAHEMKHCSCMNNWTHINSEDDIKCRVNYMSSSIPNSFCINLYYSQYIAQIRRGCNDR